MLAEKSIIPATMMTQHPDSASKYVPVQEEPEEAVYSLTPEPKGLGLEEVMVDFEGKLTPYQQTSQIVLGLLSKGIRPGSEVFVTPRIPSGAEEGVFRQLMALMSVVESNYHAWKRSGQYAVREVILPMVADVKELLSVRERINDVIALAHKEFGLSRDPNVIHLIPLFEGMPQLLKVEEILLGFLQGCRKLGVSPTRLRYMLGRSDLALTHGLIPAVLANKLAIFAGYQVADKFGIEVAPIVGGGTLPFRGHFTYENLANVVQEYRGVRTITVQSAMRYDHGRTKTIKLAHFLREKLGQAEPIKIEDREVIINFIAIFAKSYLISFRKMVAIVLRLSDTVPKQRDRLARKGEVGYARSSPNPKDLALMVGDPDIAATLSKIDFPVQRELPRAISYTGALYNIGLPPEYIGTGRGLAEVISRFGPSGLAKLLSLYPSLKTDLGFAARFVNLNNAAEFLPKDVISELEEDVKMVRKIFNIEVGPRTKKERLYHTILETMKPMLKEVCGVNGSGGIISNESLEYDLIREWIIRLGSIRGGLG
jgi:phosphoenolpyruvate carboxylase